MVLKPLVAELPLCLGRKLLLPPVRGLAIDFGDSLGCWRLPIEPIWLGFGICAGVRSGGAAGEGVAGIGGFVAIGRSDVGGIGVGVGKGAIDPGWLVDAIGRSIVGVRVGAGLDWLVGAIGRSKLARDGLARMGESIDIGVGLALVLGVDDRGKANELAGGGVDRSGGMGFSLDPSLGCGDRGWDFACLTGTGGFARDGRLNFTGVELGLGTIGLGVAVTAVVKIGGVEIGGIIGVD